MGWLAELGRQLPLIHVDTPNLGNTQACSTTHATMIAAKIAMSIFPALPFKFIVHRIHRRTLLIRGFEIISFAVSFGL
jgi:hypothetical protein